ncbi:MAG: glycoside hydrolase family 2 protein, partial [Pseudomonadota bacterium]
MNEATTLSAAIDLSGAWMLDGALDGDDMEMTLPGDILSALVAAGRVADPYWGRNEYDARWVADRDWTVRRRVSVPDAGYDLVLSQLDTVAQVTVNGVE